MSVVSRPAETTHPAPQVTGPDCSHDRLRHELELRGPADHSVARLGMAITSAQPDSRSSDAWSAYGTTSNVGDSEARPEHGKHRPRGQRCRRTRLGTPTTTSGQSCADPSSWGLVLPSPRTVGLRRAGGDLQERVSSPRRCDSGVSAGRATGAVSASCVGAAAWGSGRGGWGAVSGGYAGG